MELDSMVPDARAADAGRHDATRGVVLGAAVGAALWCALIVLLRLALD
jgi:hypothetical protein